MTSERWQQVEALFEAALAQPQETRRAFLEEARPSDPDLCREVLSLLDVADTTGPLDRLAAELMPPQSSEGEHTEGQRIGPYRVERELGHGGMGTVYLAARDDGQFEQHVALKVVREGLDSPALRARFLHERQTLARLQHPGIARLLDGGLDTDGRPFFAMEVVEGERLDRYCDTHHLDLKQRLHLFGEVCEAVHYAHQNLVVHRDLKPSNILITTNGDSIPHVKLLDFGVAKLLGHDGGEAQTQTGLRAMTPEYAAPEQVRGGAITTAADVYSLGVVLYELLTGRRPYNVHALSPAELEQVICESEPPRPSTIVTRAEAAGGDGQAASLTPEAVSVARATEPDTLARRLAGDLDTIVLKALAKEPERRYASAEAFLEDIKRHLAGLPVQARPATPGYRIRSFVRRHRVGVAAATLVVFSLVGGVIGMAWQARRATAERDRARAVATFMEDLFAAADPYAPERLDTLQVRDFLDRGATQVREELTDEPLVQAQLLHTLGHSYAGQGLPDEAESLLREAVALRRTHLGDEAPETTESLLRLALVLRTQQQFEEAGQLGQEVLAVRQRRYGEDDVRMAEVFSLLGQVAEGEGNSADAQRWHRDALEAYRSTYGDAHPQAITERRYWASALFQAGDLDAAEDAFRETVRLARQRFGATHPNTAAMQSSLAFLLMVQGRYAEAEALQREALATMRTALGPTHPQLTFHLNQLGMLLRRQGQFTESEVLLREAVALQRTHATGNYPALMSALTSLATVLRMQGKLAEAEQHQREAYTIAQTHMNEDAVLMSAERLGGILRERQHYAEAEVILLESVGASHDEENAHAYMLGPYRELVALYEAWGRPEEADRWQAHLDELQGS